MTIQDLQQRLRAHIRLRVNRHELTGRELARAAGLPQGHLSNFLNARRGLSLESMDHLLDALQIGVVELLRGDELEPGARPPRARDRLEPVALVASANAALARFRADQILGTRNFQRSFLRRLKVQAAVDRSDWQRFVLIKLEGAGAGGFFPRPVSVTLLVDRYYNSLAPYRRLHPNLYAVSVWGRCLVAHISVCENCLLLRPREPRQPIEIVPIERGRSYSDYIVGRICYVGMEV